MARLNFEGRYIWNTYGDWIATLVSGHLWDLTGLWIGWMEENGDVYRADGEWIGTLSKDSRILRKRSAGHRELRTDIPPRPERPDLPGRAPLPPTFVGLPYSVIDVLEEEPDTFKQLSERRPDLD